MKKYVLTREGIKEINPIPNEFFTQINGQPTFSVISGGFIKKSEIRKFSDDFRNLFGKYVVYGKKHYKIMNRKKFRRYEYRTGDEIYACVWTKYGLIYVAKQNENKEWVLLNGIE